MMRFRRAAGGWSALVLLVSWVAGSHAASASWVETAKAEDAAERTRIERWHDATPAERQEMRDAARDYWSHASSEERSRIRHRLRALRRALPDFSRMERRLLLRRMIEMPRAERRALRERLIEIDQLDVDERAELETELRGLIAEGTDDLHRMEENLRRWQNMTPEERDALREQARRFRRLPVEERQRLLDEWAPADVDGDRPTESDRPAAAEREAAPDPASP